MASAWLAAPVDVGAGVVVDAQTGDRHRTTGYYVEGAGRVYKDSHRRAWAGARWQRGEMQGGRSDSLSIRGDLETAVHVRAGSVKGSSDALIGGGTVGVFGAGYFVEVGARWDDNRYQDSFVLVGMTLRLPLTGIVALFR